jgi:pyruvate,orthophosphate dikinase
MLRVKGNTFKQGDWLSLDGTTGRVIAGKLKTLARAARRSRSGQVHELGRSGPPLKIRANADIPRDAKQARLFGAEGIGLCRTEHMFFAEDRIGHMRAMIWPTTRRTAAPRSRSCCPCSAPTFAGLFKAMDRCRSPSACSIHRCTSSCPSAKICWWKSGSTWKTPSPARPSSRNCAPLLARVEELHETEPHARTARLPPRHRLPRDHRDAGAPSSRPPLRSRSKGGDPHVEIMVPLIGSIEEMRNQTAIIRRVAAEVFEGEGPSVDYMVGTMIELPRAALTADQIAEEAEFFSFGTNDLTQTTFGISRDDINHFLPAYMKYGIFKQDPFATLDQAGVGLLVKMATAKGRNTRPTLKVGICGEHGGDPESVKFCHKIGLNYVSCSPFRLLTARLAAAQAALEEKRPCRQCKILRRTPL